MVSVVFGFEWLATSIWWIGYFMAYNAPNEHAALFWVKVVHSGVTFIPIFMHHFIMVFLGIQERKKKIIQANYVIGGLLWLILWKSSYLVEGVYEYYWGYYAKVGFLHSFFLAYFLLLCIDSFINLNKERRKKREEFPLEYRRITYIFWFYAIALMGSIDFLAHYGLDVYPIGFIFVMIALGIFTYAIMRYRLMDINLAITRAGILAFVYGLVLGIPFGIAVWVKPFLSEVTPNWWVLPMALLTVLASLAPFIYAKIQRKVEFRLRAAEFKSHEALRHLSHNMLRFTDLNNLLKLIVHQLVKILKLKFAAIYLFDTQADKYILKNYWRPLQPLDSSFEPPRTFSKNSSLVKDLYLRRIPVATEELKLFAPRGLSSHIRGLLGNLSDLKANTVIPSFLRNDLLGFVVLADRRTNMAFTQEDLNLLMVLSNEAALAVENAQFHQKERMTLVEKSRREALADMAPGASHQFNNRLVSISSSAELLLLKLENVKMDKVGDEDAKTVLRETKSTLELIDQEVYKGKQITSAILKRAKAKVDFQKINIQGLIENAYRLVLISHSGSGLDKFKEPKFKIGLLTKVPDIFASEALLQDCFYNLIDNAFDAMHDAARERPGIYQGELGVVLGQENNSVVIQVKDNGIGLTKENHRKLFTPYFTTKATSNKGSGLGLYIIRDFVEMHNGTIRCDSEYGKGTTFTVKIPIKKKHSGGANE